MEVSNGKSKNEAKNTKGVLLLFLILFPVVLNYLSPYLSISASSEGIVSGSLLVNDRRVRRRRLDGSVHDPRA